MIVPTMTELEADVARAIRMHRDPWEHVPGTGSRRVSQAIGRLRRKGFVETQWPTHEYVLTPAGRVKLDELDVIDARRKP
jgi:hypothetical protein